MLKLLLSAFTHTEWCFCRVMKKKIFGNLSSNVFEQRASTGSEIFPPLICLDATKFVLRSVFTLEETICLITTQVCKKSTFGWLTSLKTSLLKLAIAWGSTNHNVLLVIFAGMVKKNWKSRPNFLKFHACLSLPSVATDDRKLMRRFYWSMRSKW